MVGITPEDAVDNFAILAALAGKAAEMATARITPAELAELRELAAAVDDSDDVVAANRRFHRAINLAARSPRLLTHLRQAVRVVPGNYFELFPEQEQRSRHEHAALLDAMTRGDGRAARATMEAHVLTAGEALGGWLADLAAATRRPAHRRPDARRHSGRRPACSAASALLTLQHAVEVGPELGVVKDRSSALSAKSSVARTARSSWMLTTRLVSSTAPLGSLAMRCAQAMAWSSTSSSGQTWLTSPISAARSAGMRSPVSAYSLASWRLVSSGHTTGPAVGGHEADQRRADRRGARSPP